MRRQRSLAICGWCAPAVLVEVALFLSYRDHDARFHWFTHFFVGASLALLVMAMITTCTRRPVPYPLLWPILGHLYAMLPDFLFIGGIAHQRWMDVFLGHIWTHFVPGRNVTWYLVFVTSLALYLIALDRRVPDLRRPAAAGSGHMGARRTGTHGQI